MTSDSKILHRIQQNLDCIYVDQDNSALAQELVQLVGPSDHSDDAFYQHKWDQSDSILITYGDTIVEADKKPLSSLLRFLDHHFKETISIVHILPFFPWSSDDGFSVIDYRQVNDALGEWDDITHISDHYRLMSDVVLNHCSSRSGWFENFKKRVDPGKDYFVESDPALDHSAVVRPRTSDLLTSYETLDGAKHVWCTFSPDQVDLDFSNHQVLKEFVSIIALYMDRGIDVFRLDAVAFLWKRVGTSCIHLNETHEIIRLLRTLIELRKPNAIVITETNVPNRENLTYFGNANEAHVIYNFSLPPLLVHTLLTGNCRHLKTWMMSMPPAQMGTTYLNFIASHDGIGLRPAEGLLSDQERDTLITTIEGFGGKTSWRTAAGQDPKPYEMNVSLIDALKGTVDGEDQFQFERFICAHTIMMALEGIPAFYIHSMLATPNDYDHMEHTGRYRSINRHQWSMQELEASLADPESLNARVMEEMNRLIGIRKHQPAFHPNAVQFTMHLGLEIFAFWRQSIMRDQSIFCLTNVTDKAQEVPLYEVNLINTDDWIDLISGNEIEDLDGVLSLAPYQSVWLTNRQFA